MAEQVAAGDAAQRPFQRVAARLSHGVRLVRLDPSVKLLPPIGNMQALISVAAIVAMLGTGGCALAVDYREPLSGAHLIELCDGPQADPTACAIYIDGVRSGMRAYRLFLAWKAKEGDIHFPPSIDLLLKGEPYCIPSGVGQTEIAQTAVTFIKQSKSAAEESAAFSIIFALKQAYPCNVPPP